jgi:hypothetical protein
MKQALVLVLLLTTSGVSAQTVDTIRVCTYNLTNWNDSLVFQVDAIDSIRWNAIGTVLKAVDPDILVVPGFSPEGGFVSVALLLDDIVENNEYDLQFFNPTSKSCIVLLYKPSKCQFLNSHRLGREWYDKEANNVGLSSFRDWRFKIKKTGDTIHVLACEFMAGNSDSNARIRAKEARMLRKKLERGSPLSLWMVAGTLNTHTSNEEAYQLLTARRVSFSDIYFYDPLNRPGDWHSNATFADVHTYSSGRQTSEDGIGDGLNDRLDFLLLSDRLLKEHYVPGSYTTFGNDARHFHASVGTLPNHVVHDSIAQALNYASDHLPVYLDLVFPSKKKEASQKPENTPTMVPKLGD